MTEKTNFFENLAGLNVYDLDYDTKSRLLEQLIVELAQVGIEYGPVAARAAELRSRVQVLSNIKSALQSAIRAEQQADGKI